MSKGQKAAAVKVMAGTAERAMAAKAMAANAEAVRAGAKAKVRRAEAKEFMG